MSKFVRINDPMGGFTLNSDKVIAISEDVEGKFGCLINVEGITDPIRLRTSYDKIAALFT